MCHGHTNGDVGGMFIARDSNMLDAFRGEGRFPALVKGGGGPAPALVRGGGTRHKKKCREPSLMERTGGEAASPIGRSNQQVLVQLPINRCLDRTAPSAPLRRLRAFSYGRSHPALAKAGNMPLVNRSAAAC